MNIRKALRDIPVDRVVSRDFALTRSGERYLRGMDHNSLVVDLEKNKWFWNSLNLYGDAYDWLIKIRGYSSIDALKILQQYTHEPLHRVVYESLFKPQGPYYKLLKVFHDLGKIRRSYWYGRGYTDDTIDLFQLGYSGEHYVIPILFEGKLLNFQCRTPQKRIWTWTKRRGIEPFNFDILPDTSWVIITESPVDAIIATQHGFPAISLLPNALNWDRNLSQYLTSMRKIYLAFDNDLAGEHGLKKVGKQFPHKVWVVDWKGYPNKWDVGDVLKPGTDKAINEFSSLLDNCLPYKAITDSKQKQELYRLIRSLDI